MKQNKRIFNQLLYSYHKSIRKLANLRSENKNLRRQGIIERRIEKLFSRLTLLKARIQKLSIAGILAVSAFTFMGNDAKAQYPVFDAKQTNPFNLNNAGYSNPKPEFVDIDNDGDYDVFANSYVYPGGNVFLYYENTGTNTNPSFAAPSQNPFGIVTYNPGPPSYLYGPNFSFDFVDLDGDGDFDIVAKTNYSSTFYFYQNTGTNSAPTFAVPVGLSIPGTHPYEEHPVFADIDNDGDFDMMTGYSYNFYYSSNEIKYYENIGTNLSPTFATPLSNPFGLSVSVDQPTPELVDLDGDGDFDLMIGTTDNNIGFVFYENTGTNLVPSFGAPQNSPFGITTSYYDQRTNPTMVDLDGDGNIDLLSGNNDGEFIYFQNNGICFPTSSTISPSAACSYLSPLGNLYTTDGTYIEIINNAGGCDSTITINLTINPIADQTIFAAPSTVCSGSTSFINLNSSDNGIQYYLRDDSNDNIVAGPVVGTGTGIVINTGSLTSATTYNVLAIGSAGTQGLSFDGNDDKVDCGNDVSVQLSGTAITLEAWIYPTAWKSNVWEGNIINKEECCPDQGYMLRCGDNGTLNFNIGDGGWNEINSAQGALTLNTWQHVAGSYDGTTMSLYIDGVLVASSSENFSFFSNNGNLTIGNWSQGNDRAFEGVIDDVRVWSVSKTQTEIQNDMSSCLTGSETGLRGYHQFANLSGSTLVTDLSGNGNTGTLSDMDENTAWVEGYGNCMDCSLELTGTVTVNINQTTTSTINPTACLSYTAPSGTVYTTSGSYTDIISNVAGCDSTITINLTVNTVNVNVTDNNPTFTATATGTYQWIDCVSENAISGETGQSFTATSNGTYAVVVTENGCSDTSSCYTVSTVGVMESSSDKISIYPNPTRGMINVNISESEGVFAYEITSIDGKIIQPISNFNQKVLNVDLTNEANGIYFLRLIGNNETKLVKIIKH